MPLSKLKQISKGDGWMQDRLEKVEEEEHQVKTGKTKDVEIVKYYGDISISRSDGDIYLHQKATVKQVMSMDLANRKVVMFATHGLVPGELDGLTQPALALSSPEVTGEKAGDGLPELVEQLINN